MPGSAPQGRVGATCILHYSIAIWYSPPIGQAVSRENRSGIALADELAEAYLRLPEVRMLDNETLEIHLCDKRLIIARGIAERSDVQLRGRLFLPRVVLERMRRQPTTACLRAATYLGSTSFGPFRPSFHPCRYFLESFATPRIPGRSDRNRRYICQPG